MSGYKLDVEQEVKSCKDKIDLIKKQPVSVEQKGALSKATEAYEAAVEKFEDIETGMPSFFIGIAKQSVKQAVESPKPLTERDLPLALREDKTELEKLRQKAAKLRRESSETRKEAILTIDFR